MAELVDRPLRQRLHRRRVGHVGRDRDGTTATVADAGGDPLDLVGTTGGAHHGRAGVGEGGGDALTDPAAGAGHDGDVVAQVEQLLAGHGGHGDSDRLVGLLLGVAM